MALAYNAHVDGVALDVGDGVLVALAGPLLGLLSPMALYMAHLAILVVVSHVVELGMET